MTTKPKNDQPNWRAILVLTLVVAMAIASLLLTRVLPVPPTDIELTRERLFHSNPGAQEILALTQTIAPSTTPTPGPTDVIAVDDGSCRFWWHREPLPEVISDVENALTDADLDWDLVSIYEFGETCTARDGTLRGFSIMQTDVEITLPITSFDDAESRALAVLDVLRATLPDTFRGPLPGRMLLTFTTGDERRVVELSVQAARTLDSTALAPTIQPQLENE